MLYIGTINYEAGRTAGGTLVDMLDLGRGRGHPGWNDEPTFPDGYNRTMGAKDVLEEARHIVTVRETNFKPTATSTTPSTWRTRSRRSIPVIGLLSMFSPSYRCARAAEEADRTAEDVTIVGFDFEPETQSYMQSGLIRATHTQRQYYFGYLTPYVLYSFNVLGVGKTMDILAPWSTSCSTRASTSCSTTRWTSTRRTSTRSGSAGEPIAHPARGPDLDLATHERRHATVACTQGRHALGCVIQITLLRLVLQLLRSFCHALGADGEAAALELVEPSRASLASWLDTAQVELATRLPEHDR